MKSQTIIVARVSTAILMLLLLLPAPAPAHIKNEATQFPDIEFSEARFDIVVLVGAGIIPETPVFEPDKPLTMRELATWVALANGLARGGETPDVDVLANAAIEAGAVDRLTGNASYADINALLFSGGLDLSQAAETPTKAEAASLIAAQLDTDAGADLLQKRGLRPGATGDVVAVGTQEGHHGSAYVVTVGSTTLPMDEHGRVANGPTDLLQWEGRRVRRSFVRGSDDHARWIYLEAEPRQPAQPVAETSPEVFEPVPEPPPRQRSTLYWLLAAVAVLAVLLFFRRRRD